MTGEGVPIAASLLVDGASIEERLIVGGAISVVVCSVDERVAVRLGFEVFCGQNQQSGRDGCGLDEREERHVNGVGRAFVFHDEERKKVIEYIHAKKIRNVPKGANNVQKQHHRNGQHKLEGNGATRFVERALHQTIRPERSQPLHRTQQTNHRRRHH